MNKEIEKCYHSTHPCLVEDLVGRYLVERAGAEDLLVVLLLPRELERREPGGVAVLGREQHQRRHRQ